MNTVAENLPKPHRYSVDDLRRMVSAGILMDDERVELIEGELIDMLPIGALHSGIVNRLTRRLVLAAGDQAIVSVQNGLRLGDLNLPQPDLALLRPQADDYMLRLPNARDALLIIEVSDSTLSYDQKRKLPLYASHDIPETWIVDLSNQRILRYRAPGKQSYTQSDEIEGTVTLTAQHSCQIDLAGLFGI